jgi:hypothetical protein
MRWLDPPASKRSATTLIVYLKRDVEVGGHCLQHPNHAERSGSGRGALARLVLQRGNPGGSTNRRSPLLPTRDQGRVEIDLKDDHGLASISSVRRSHLPSTAAAS